ncbi:MAG: aspartyl protease family protein [Spirochaetaceae bacterium]|jgi:clan AA aspartic protease|nr:aspartyl protease family protein [Spirochaetaceae bacterium]
MGLTYTTITLVNSGDIIAVDRGYMKEQDVRRITVRALVDTGSITLVINDKICQQLGLMVSEYTNVTLAGGARSAAKLAGPVQVRWEDRLTHCDALVLPGESEVLLGAIPLEGMDLEVHPATQTVAGAHGSKRVFTVK